VAPRYRLEVPAFVEGFHRFLALACESIRRCFATSFPFSPATLTLDLPTAIICEATRYDFFEAADEIQFNDNNNELDQVVLVARSPFHPNNLLTAANDISRNHLAPLLPPKPAVRLRPALPIAWQSLRFRNPLVAWPACVL